MLESMKGTIATPDISHAFESNEEEDNKKGLVFEDKGIRVFEHQITDEETGQRRYHLWQPNPFEKENKRILVITSPTGGPTKRKRIKQVQKTRKLLAPQRKTLQKKPQMIQI